MQTCSLPPLGAAVAAAVPAALLAPRCLPLAALWAAGALLLALWSARPVCRAGLAALPALLAAVPRPTAAPPIATPGPVAVAGIVARVVNVPLLGHSRVTLQPEAAGVHLLFTAQVDLCPGDRVQVLAHRAAPIAPGHAPGLHAVTATLRSRPGPWSLPRAAAALRAAMERALLRLVPGEHGAMLATLVLGRGTRPSPALAAAHRDTGLSHLLAVSGAHAAMLAMLLGWSSRGRRLGASRRRALTVMLLLFAYGGVAGGEPPVLRALLAFALAALAARRGRPFGAAPGLLLPALVTCIVQPDALLGPSFLLSYAAVVGLALGLRGRPGEGFFGWLGDALRASVWATLCTAPLTLWFFGQLAPCTILLTPLCAPLVAAMLLLGLIAGALGACATPLAVPLGPLLEGLAAVYAAIVHAADALPGTPIHAPCRPPWWSVALFAASSAALVLHRPSRRRAAVAIALGCAPWFLPPPLRPHAGLQLFAVGHGQAALLVTDRGDQVVVDCGSLHGATLAAAAIDGALDRRRIDLLIVTHDDQDHHNGVPPLLARVPVTAALLPAAMRDSALDLALRRHGADVQFAAAGAVLRPLPDLESFVPALPPDAADNDRSLWLSGRVAGTRVLLTGDAEATGIAAALIAGFAGPSEVLVLPHHGRPNDLAAQLLAAVRPSACLASAAREDGETALGRLARRSGADLWVTGLHGTITLRGPPATITAAAPRQLADR
ncbi:MAG: ComEC/Rec2 family competence protein [Planctomycetes bacterium]|nr:ComEC/Rec2 family competence protein [Planctomycetota bacterium]